MLKFDSEAFIREMESLEGVEETPLDYEDFEQEEYERMNWETCKCEDCKKVKELFSDLSFYWDNEEEIKEIERTIESIGYSI